MFPTKDDAISYAQFASVDVRSLFVTPAARAWKGKLAVMQAASSRQTIRGSVPFDDTNRILRSEMIPIEDALAAMKLVFNAISGILKANRDKILTVDQIEEIFAEMRRVTDWLQEKANGASASLDLSSASALNRPTLRTP